MKKMISPDTAMILAAGLGKRMRPVTDSMPKPLVRVLGKTLIDRNLDALAAAGVKRTIVNVHYLADQMKSHLAGRQAPEIIISDETEGLLDSGGGVMKALSAIGNEPFFLMNSDSFWLEGSKPNLEQLAAGWEGGKMDMLLLLSSLPASIGFDGNGDFFMDGDGRLERRTESRIAPFAYAGAAIVHPRIFRDVPDGPFSLNILFDRAIEEGRLFGMRMDGLWLHVGTPEAIHLAETAIAKSAA